MSLPNSIDRGVRAALLRVEKDLSGAGQIRIIKLPDEDMPAYGEARITGPERELSPHGEVRIMKSRKGFPPYREVKILEELSASAPKDRDQIHTLIAAALESREKHWSPRAVAFLSEIIAVGVLARSHYNEQPLGTKQVIVLAGILEQVLNSWLHE